MKNVKNFVIILLCATLFLSLAGCTEPEIKHNHEVKETITEEVMGYAWERSTLCTWQVSNLQAVTARNSYVPLHNDFSEPAAFLVQHEVNGKVESAFIQFEITNIDTYADIMQHLYEPFDICIDHITYTDGCTTKQFRLIGLHEQTENTQ